MPHFFTTTIGCCLLVIFRYAVMANAYSGTLDSSIERKSELYPAFVEQLPSLTGKTVSVTGASRGLGYITALTCARKGAEVIMLGRKSEAADRALDAIKEAAASLGDECPAPVFVECDHLHFASVREAASCVRDITRERGLDVLCCNAGIMLQEDVASKDGYDITIQTNVLAHFLITKELMPSLKKAEQLRGESRIVSMSSGSGFGPPAFNPVYFTRRGGTLGGGRASYDRYHQSKLANLVFTAALDDRLRANGSNAKAVACTPGVCGTDMFAHATKVMSGRPAPRSNVPSTEDGSLSQLKCIFDPKIESGDLWGPGRGMGGLPAKVDNSPPTILINEEVKTELWKLCEDAVGQFSL
jgi:NAD(P)-dependent dehydrogenase (short-subunit alcohol dehydrogenase family)